MLLTAIMTVIVAGASSFAGESPKPGKKKSVKKKTYDYERSKYKSRDLTDNTHNTYRFNEKGEPVVSGEKKSSADDDSKAQGAPAQDAKAQPEACGPSKSCAEKKPVVDDL